VHKKTHKKAATSPPSCAWLLSRSNALGYCYFLSLSASLGLRLDDVLGFGYRLGFPCGFGFTFGLATLIFSAGLSARKPSRTAHRKKFASTTK
jgi:hypothetical protein